MQKIILNERNFGIIIGRLKQMLGKPHEVTHDWDKNPLSKSTFKNENYYINTSSKAIVTKHPMKDSHCLANEKRPFIHIDFNDGMNYAYYSEGDIFYFFGGNKIIIKQPNSTMASVLGRNSLVELYQRSDKTEEELVQIEQEKAMELRDYEKMDELISWM